MRSQPWWPALTKAWKAIALVAVAAAAAWGGYALNFAFNQGSRTDVIENSAVHQMFALSLPDPQGNTQALSQWRGKILVINFWATWCEPCREEIPGLQRLREKYVGKNVEVVGIAVDSVAKVRDYATQFKIAYPLVVGGMETIELARSLGNKAGGLPFTIVLDARSAIVLSHLGLIKEQALDQKLADLVR